MNGQSIRETSSHYSGAALVRRRLPLVTATACFLLSGCLSYTTLQSPEVLARSRKEIGLGVGGHFGNPYGYVKPIDVSVMGRMGLGYNLDAGLTLFNTGILLDAKYQFVRQPVLGAFDLGVSYCYLADPEAGYHSIQALYPTLLVGSERLYGGVKCILGRDVKLDTQGRNDNTSAYVFPGLLVGASLGRAFRVRPELTLYAISRKSDASDLTGWKLLPYVSLGLQRRF